MEVKISESYDDLKIFKSRLSIPESSAVNNIPSFSLRQTNINSRECPHCGSHYVISNGNYKGRKRYFCNNCRKTYNDLTNTPFSGIHDLDKILLYLKCMIRGTSIRKAALEVKVSVLTSFKWRHKLLDAISSLPSPKMKNVIEMQEVELPYSHKGQRTYLSEELRKSKLSAIFVCDRTGKMDSDSIPYLERGRNPVFKRINDISNMHCDLIRPTNLYNITNFHEINLKSENRHYSQLNTITKIISFWQQWMKRFHGVASKYLSHYLHWYDFLDNSLNHNNRVSALTQLLLKH